MKKGSAAKAKKLVGPGKLESYIIGFVFSIVLTLVAYVSAAESLVGGWALWFTLGALAFLQVVIQLVFFLHLGEEPAPPWNLIVFLFMVLTVFIIVMGSLWVMHQLDYQMVKPKEVHKEGHV